MASRSLGTLTLDLVAKIGGFESGMDKAARTSKQRMDDIKKSATVAGKALTLALGAGAVAAAGGLAVVVNRQRDLIDQQAKLAQRLRTSYESLSNLGRAGELAGVSMQQIEVAGRTLDVSLGRAAQGTGAQAKAFEKLRLNADEIAKLPLDERIKAINTALSENVPLTERAAVAADLFGTRGAAAIQMLTPDTIAEAARQAKIFGLNLSDIDAAKVEMANDAMSTFNLLVDGAGKQLTVTLAPILRSIGDEFLRSAEEAGGLGAVVQDSVNQSINALAFLVDAGDGVKRAFEIVADVLVGTFANIQAHVIDAAAWITEAVDSIPGVDLTIEAENLRKQADVAFRIVEEARKSIGESLTEPLAGDRLRQFIKDAESAGQAAAEAAVRARTAITGGESDGGEAGQIDKLKAFIDGLKEQADTLGFSARQMAIYKAEIMGAGESQVALINSLYDQIEAFDESQKSIEELNDRIGKFRDATAPDFGGISPEIGGAFSELNRIEEAREQLQEWYDDQLALLDEFRSKRSDLNAVWDEEELDRKKEFEEQLASIERARQVTQLAAAEETFGHLSDIAKTFAGEQSGIYKAMFALEKAAAIARSIVAIQTGIAEAAANPWPINLGAMASVAAATAGIVSTIASTNIKGLRYGGIARPGEIVELAEPGNPELLRMGNKTFFVPGSMPGIVEPAKRISGDMAMPKNAQIAPNVQITNNGAPMEVKSSQWDGRTLRMVVDSAVAEARAAVASDIANREGAGRLLRNSARDSGGIG